MVSKTWEEVSSSTVTSYLQELQPLPCVSEEIHGEDTAIHGWITWRAEVSLASETVFKSNIVFSLGKSSFGKMPFKTVTESMFLNIEGVNWSYAIFVCTVLGLNCSNVYKSRVLSHLHIKLLAVYMAVKVCKSITCKPSVYCLFQFNIYIFLH